MTYISGRHRSPTKSSGPSDECSHMDIGGNGRCEIWDVLGVVPSVLVVVASYVVRIISVTEHQSVSPFVRFL